MGIHGVSHMISHEISEYLFGKSEHLFELVEHLFVFGAHCSLPTLILVTIALLSVPMGLCIVNRMQKELLRETPETFHRSDTLNTMIHAISLEMQRVSLQALSPQTANRSLEVNH